MKRKFQPTPRTTSAAKKFPKAIPARFTATQRAWSTAPTSMIRGAPNRAIKCPVKNEGRNMPTICAWITIAESSNPKPQSCIARGVTVIMKVMTT